MDQSGPKNLLSPVVGPQFPRIHHPMSPHILESDVDMLVVLKSESKKWYFGISLYKMCGLLMNRCGWINPEPWFIFKALSRLPAGIPWMSESKVILGVNSKVRGAQGVYPSRYPDLIHPLDQFLEVWSIWSCCPRLTQILEAKVKMLAVQTMIK